MIPIAKSGKVTIFCPIDGQYSFNNSPYPSHRLLSGIDIYPKREWGEIAVSPIKGKVIKIRKVMSPRARVFKDSGYDVVTLFQSLEDSSRIIKALHIDPILKVGDIVKPGQKLGKLLRSGYFGFGTSPHVHVEVRKPSDPLRARGGYPISRLFKVKEVEPVKELRGTVIKSVPEYTIVNLDTVFSDGIPADIGGAIGILDGGIPHYGWFGAHLDDGYPTGEFVRLCSEKIGIITNIIDKTCFANCTNFNVYVKNNILLGLSLRLSPRTQSELKLLPLKIGGLLLRKGSKLCLNIKNMPKNGFSSP